MGVLTGLEPSSVFQFFEEIAAIPHPSYHEKQISDYLVDFAKKRGLEWYQDALYNVIIIKEATPGCENAEPIILQGHMDMVAEKNPGCPKDMFTEGLDLGVDGDYVYAKDTTLGGDDGIAVAYALAILDDDTLKHPRIEFVCTVSEEVGMDGAHALDVSPLKGHLLLNLDSESEGSVLAGCAGGGGVHIDLPVEREAEASALGGYERVLLTIGGLCGGHSGTEIDKGHASSTMIMARILREAAATTDVRLVSLESGSKDNAIPREAKAVLYVRDYVIFEHLVNSLEAEIREEYISAGENVSFELTDTGCIRDARSFAPISAEDVATLAEAGFPAADQAPLTKESMSAVITMLTALPNGVIRMSMDIPGLVETSLNLGICSLKKDKLHLVLSVRSSVGTAFTDLTGRLHWIAEHLGADFSITGAYPAWEFVRTSAFRDRLVEIYRELFGKELKVATIHAGVECGLLADKIPGLDAVSMGPEILDIHTPRERLSISSTARMYTYIRRIIEDAAEAGK